MSDKEPTPATRSAAFAAMEPRWALMNAVLGGTEAMRSAGLSLLPKHPEESDASWRRRIETATLLNLTELTLDMLSGKPFSEPLQLEEVSTQFSDWSENIDLQGNNLEVFARRWFRDGLAKGLSHVLVDMPRIRKPVEGEKPRTVADDVEENVRPYLVHVPADSLIFMGVRMADGKEVIDHIRIAESTVERSGWGEQVKHRVRVMEPGKVQIWELQKEAKTRREKWVMVDEWDTGLTVVPLVTFYTDQGSAGVVKPPLLDLAYMNVRHWQLSSDLDNIVSVACFPMLAMSGVDTYTPKPGDGSPSGESVMRIGPNQILATRSELGKFYYVEHTGAAIRTGMDHLQRLEDQMSSYGAQFLRKKPGDMKATVRALDSAESLSQLQSMALSFKDAVEQALVFMALWTGSEDSPSVKISTDFGMDDPSEESWKPLDAARQRRDISRRAYLSEMKRRGYLSDDYDPEEDMAAIESESQDLIQGAETGAPVLPPENRDL